jgi:hypothetical protein
MVAVMLMGVAAIVLHCIAACSEMADPVITAAADPLSWTRAPLFVARRDTPSSADPAQTAERPADTPAAPSAREISADAPRPDGLFVTRTDAGRPR